jgi:nucleotide-binding universal stress UspA family protein
VRSRNLTSRSAREGTCPGEKGVLLVIHHVLVPTDGSENAERAVRFSAQVADRRQQAEVTVVYVHLRVPPAAHQGASGLEPEQSVQKVPPLSDEPDNEELVHAREIVDRAVAEIKSLVTSPDVTVTGRVVVDTRVDEGVLQVADEVKADIIVMGTRGLSTLRGAIMGSVSHALIEKATCPVLIVK